MEVSFSSLLWFLLVLFKEEARAGKAEKLLCHEVTALSLCPWHLHPPHPSSETGKQKPEKGTKCFITSVP